MLTKHAVTRIIRWWESECGDPEPGALGDVLALRKIRMHVNLCEARAIDTALRSGASADAVVRATGLSMRQVQISWQVAASLDEYQWALTGGLLGRPPEDYDLVALKLGMEPRERIDLSTNDE